MPERVQDRLWRLGLRAAYRARLLGWALTRPTLYGAAVAVWHGERLLVIRNSYRRLLSLPAGGLHRGEAPSQAARRELREEVGIDAPAGALREAGEIVWRVHHAVDHVHVFELRLERPPVLRIDRREVIWAGFLAPEEATRRGLVEYVRRYLEARSPLG